MQVLFIIGCAILTIFATCVGERLLRIVNQKIRNEKVNSIFRHIKNIVLDNVKATQQKYVDELKEKDQFNEEEHSRVLMLTKDNVMSTLSKESKEYIKKAHGDIEVFIVCQIEATIYDLKY